MWLECDDIIVNMEHVDYVSFEKTEIGYKANIFFESGDILNFEHEDIEILKNHFKKVK